MFCPECGSRVDDAAAFCGECGMRIEVESTSIPVPGTPQFEQKEIERTLESSSTRSWLIGGVVLIAATGICLGALIYVIGNGDGESRDTANAEISNPSETAVSPPNPTDEPVTLFVERCECGGIFTIDSFETSDFGFSFSMTIENTGQAGTLVFTPSNSEVHAFNASEADEYRRLFVEDQAQLGTVGRKVFPTTAFRPNPDGSQTAFSDAISLAPGDSWRGHFSAGHTLPVRTVSILIRLNHFVFNAGTPAEEPLSWISADAQRPFIELP
jgi:hypothetical protein